MKESVVKSVSILIPNVCSLVSKIRENIIKKFTVHSTQIKSKEVVTQCTFHLFIVINRRARVLTVVS